MSTHLDSSTPHAYVVEHFVSKLNQLAPPELAESWDNVGLLVGDPGMACKRVMTCLSITTAVVDEAVSRQVDLIVTHHPLPFQPLTRITSESTAGRFLLKLIENRTAIYSAHTAFDSANHGINQQLAEGVGLEKCQPMIIRPGAVDRGAADTRVSDPRGVLGSGRWGSLPEQITAGSLAKMACRLTNASSARLVGSCDRAVRTIAFGCGSGGSFLGKAVELGCDALVTGEATFHTCLEAESQGISLVLLGHYASERFAMDWLAGWLSETMPNIEAWASCDEADPLTELVS
jgi:dinuclear metal center YbgI/SA1388 family protein